MAPPNVPGLFIGSLNEVIDLHAKRLALGVRNRFPGTIWAALSFVAIIGTSVMGYHAGLAGSGRSLALLALVLAFSAVVMLIVDLDRPQEGLLRVSQQTMTDLQKTLAAPRR
jgi:zinc transporter ZupT